MISIFDMWADKRLKNCRKTLLIHVIESLANYPHKRIGFIYFFLTCASKLCDESKVTPISFTLSVLVSVMCSGPSVYPSFLMLDSPILIWLHLFG